MAAPIRAAGYAARRAASTAAAGAPRAEKKDTKFLKQGSKRDPELYILGTIMAGAFGLAGYYFARKPTAATSESSTHMVQGTMPWQVEGDGKDSFKYQYHPRGDKSASPKNAPSALNTVIIPNVTLPKELHEKFNKWGDEEFE